jgi:hypothetical protein
VHRGFRLEFALALMILVRVFRSNHPDGLGARLRERQSRRAPELDLVSLAVPLLGEGGTAMSKQPHGRQY